MNIKELAPIIIEKVGGEKNIINVVHCATRLRFTLKDWSKVDKAALEAQSGILQVIEAGGQLQIVIGTEVSDMYQAIISQGKFSDENITSRSNKKILDMIFETFSGIFTPFVPVLAGAGLLRGILTLLVSIGWLSNDTGTYTILYAAADTILYFLPLYLAITSAKYFKVNEFIALTIAGSLLYPTLLSAYSSSLNLQFMGINVILIKYVSSVVPIIISVFVLSKFDKIIRKSMPAVIKSFATPLIDLVVMIPLTILVIGPIFTFATNIFTNGFLSVYNFNPIIFGFAFGACWHPLVIFGLHRGFIPINLNNLASTGRDPLLAMTMPSNFAQTGAALGVALKSKNKDFKAVAGSGVLGGLLGITEPIVYGVTLKAKRTFYYSCLMAGIGGAIIASAGCYAIGLPAGGLLATPVFAEKALIWYIAACGMAFIGSFLLTVIFGFDDVGDVNNDKSIKVASQKAGIKLSSPVSGTIVDLTEVNDNLFKSLSLGKGIAVKPDDCKIFSPYNGKITSLFHTKHAIGITTEEGVEILLHIGIDTIKLAGRGFQSHVQQGDSVKKGQLLVEADMDYINEKGLDTITMMVITNTKNFSDISTLASGNVSHKEDILSIV